MFVIDACSATSASQGPIRHYGRAKPLGAQALTISAQQHPKLRLMLPHFARQETDASCSVASAATLINTVRAAMGRRPVTQDQVVRSDASGLWASATRDAHSDGVDLDGMALHVMQSFYALVSKHVTADVRRVGPHRTDFKKALESSLIDGENQPLDHFIITNARQSDLFTEGEPIGHMSVVGAYDAAAQKVLVLDVDNRDPMPYWVKLSTLVDAMDTADDVTGEKRGYVLVRMNHS